MPGFSMAVPSAVVPPLCPRAVDGGGIHDPHPSRLATSLADTSVTQMDPIAVYDPNRLLPLLDPYAAAQPFPALQSDLRAQLTPLLQQRAPGALIPLLHRTTDLLRDRIAAAAEDLDACVGSLMLLDRACKSLVKTEWKEWETEARSVAEELERRTGGDNGTTDWRELPTYQDTAGDIEWYMGRSEEMFSRLSWLSLDNFPFKPRTTTSRGVLQALILLFQEAAGLAKKGNKPDVRCDRKLRAMDQKESEMRVVVAFAEAGQLGKTRIRQVSAELKSMSAAQVEAKFDATGVQFPQLAADAQVSAGFHGPLHSTTLPRLGALPPSFAGSSPDPGSQRASADSSPMPASQNPDPLNPRRREAVVARQSTSSRLSSPHKTDSESKAAGLKQRRTTTSKAARRRSRKTDRGESADQRGGDDEDKEVTSGDDADDERRDKEGSDDWTGDKEMRHEEDMEEAEKEATNEEGREGNKKRDAGKWVRQELFAENPGRLARYAGSPSSDDGVSSDEQTKEGENAGGTGLAHAGQWKGKEARPSPPPPLVLAPADTRPRPSQSAVDIPARLFSPANPFAPRQPPAPHPPSQSSRQAAHPHVPEETSAACRARKGKGRAATAGSSPVADQDPPRRSRGQGKPTETAVKPQWHPRFESLALQQLYQATAAIDMPDVTEETESRPYNMPFSSQERRGRHLSTREESVERWRGQAGNDPTVLAERLVDLEDEIERQIEKRREMAALRVAMEAATHLIGAPVPLWNNEGDCIGLVERTGQYYFGTDTSEKEDSPSPRRPRSADAPADPGQKWRLQAERIEGPRQPATSPPIASLPTREHEEAHEESAPLPSPVQAAVIPEPSPLHILAVFGIEPAGPPPKAATFFAPGSCEAAPQVLALAAAEGTSSSIGLEDEMAELRRPEFVIDADFRSRLQSRMTGILEAEDWGTECRFRGFARVPVERRALFIEAVKAALKEVRTRLEGRRTDAVETSVGTEKIGRERLVIQEDQIYQVWSKEDDLQRMLDEATEAHEANPTPASTPSHSQNLPASQHLPAAPSPLIRGPVVPRQGLGFRLSKPSASDSTRESSKGQGSGTRKRREMAGGDENPKPEEEEKKEKRQKLACDVLSPLPPADNVTGGDDDEKGAVCADNRTWTSKG